jgi:hypothetical protein
MISRDAFAVALELLFFIFLIVSKRPLFRATYPGASQVIEA